MYPHGNHHNGFMATPAIDKDQYSNILSNMLNKLYEILGKITVQSHVNVCVFYRLHGKVSTVTGAKQEEIFR